MDAATRTKMSMERRSIAQIQTRLSIDPWSKLMLTPSDKAALSEPSAKAALSEPYDDDDDDDRGRARPPRSNTRAPLPRACAVCG
eukprot:3773680-Prymnesium_polylepis.1